MAVIRSIPANTNLVIRQTEATPPRAYKTKKLIQLPAGKLTQAACPITRSPVFTAVANGVRIYFKTEQIRERYVPDDGTVNYDVLPSRSPCFLFYDIPTDSDIANPSGLLRRFAIRCNLSCWLVSEHDMPYRLINSLNEAGANCRIIKVDPEGSKELIQMAIEAIRKEIEDMVSRAEKTLESCETKTAKQQEAAQERVNKRLESAVRELTEAAARFGISPEALCLGDNIITTDAVDASFKHRMRLIVRMSDSLRQSGQAGMADALDNNGVHPAIAADMLEETTGDSTLAESVRDSFLGDR